MNHTQNTPDGMVSVSKQAFYATVGKLDVHPCIVNDKFNRDFGYKSHWKTRHGLMVGLSMGLCNNTQYWVTSDFFAKNRDAITLATENAA